MKKNITKVLVFIGFIVTVIGLLIEGLDEEYTAIIMASVFTYPFIAATLAVCFVQANNVVVKNVGYALCALVGVYGILALTAEVLSTAPIGMIIMLVGAFGYAVLYVLEFFGFVKKDSVSAQHGDIAVLLTKYKEMETDGIISEEEFSQLKEQTVKGCRASTIDDLKRWKKLLDQKVITEQEFAEIKSTTFKK